ncbi:alpha/beta hydrolase [Urechidicola sp. KH5]
MLKKITFTFLLLLLVQICNARDIKETIKFKPDASVVYKSIGKSDLKLHFFYPSNHKISNKTPVIVFFHGGGWRGGGPSQFFNQSKYFASRGLVAVSVQYRTEKSHGTSPKDCVKDGKSAIRWIRSHAGEYGIDPDKMIASGGSAGGHIAASTAILDKYNETGEDTSTSCMPNALVLFNPVINNGNEGFGYELVKEYWKDISPAHNLKRGLPPTLILLGTKDTAFKPHLAQKFKQEMEGFGNECKLMLYKDQVHAFFNISHRDMHFKTMADADTFLISLGYLNGKPTTDKFRKTVFPNEKKTQSFKP